MKRKRNILEEFHCKITESNTMTTNNKINLKISIPQNICEICKIKVDNYDYHINHKVCCSHDCFCVLYLSLQDRFIDEKRRDKYSFDENELMIIE